MAGYEQEGAQRAGHIPGAASVPWAQAVKEDGTFKTADELRELYTGKGVIDGHPIIAYCRIGERSAHTWFVLHELLGEDDVKNYDGSWTEWGNMVAVPIEKDVPRAVGAGRRQPLEERLHDPCGRSPDEMPVDRVGRRLDRHALADQALHLMARDQVGQRELEHLSHLGCLGSPGLSSARRSRRRERLGSRSRTCRPEGSAPTTSTRSGIEADLLVGLA